MCGVYGYHRRTAAPEPGLLRDLALLAGRRGPHAHGHATRGARHVALGPTVAGDWSTVVDSVIGHARLATAGGHDDLACAQPLHTGRLFIAHNGTVPAAGFHAAREGLTPTTASDSEVLGLLLARAAFPDGVAAVLDQLTPSTPLALLILDVDGTVVAARRGHPLHALQRPEGTYLCSLPFPGSLPLADQAVTVFGRHGAHTLPLATTASLRAHTGGPAWTT